MKKPINKISAGQKEFLSSKNIFTWAKETGIQYASLHGFINGTSFLTVHNLAKLCEVAGITVDEFLKK